MKNYIGIINMKIKEIIRQLNEVNEALNIYYEINNDLINNYDPKNRNYQILENLKEININNTIYVQLKKIKSNFNNKNSLIDLIDLYNNLDLHNNKMKINYNIENQKIIKLFDNKFVNNNKKNCYLSINNKRHKLCEYLEIDNNIHNQNTL